MLNLSVRVLQHGCVYGRHNALPDDPATQRVTIVVQRYPSTTRVSYPTHNRTFVFHTTR